MSHIPEDRHKHGLVLDYSLEQNMVLQRYWAPEFQKHGFIKSKAVRDHAVRLIEQYDVRSGQGPVTITRSMSGGNQQKVLLAKWMFAEPDILILDEPTRGIDVGAKHEIYEIMSDLAKQGKAIIMISSEMSELLGMADRICVMCNGKLTGEIDQPEEMTQARVMGFATKF